MKAQSLKNAILQLAIQGKLVPQNEQEEPAQILLEKIKVEKAQLVKDKKIKAEKALPPITNEEKPFDIPDSWKWVRLRDIVYNWGQKNPDVNFYYIDVGSINSTIGCVGDCSIIEPQNAPSRARKLVKDGTVIYSTVRPYLLNIAIVDNKDGKELIASTAFAIMHPFEGVYNKYLFYYLRSKTFVDYVNSQMIGVAYPAINDQKLYYGTMPLPPLFEQYRIVEKIEQLMPLVEMYDRFEQELSALEVNFPQNLKKSILQYAVQGKLVPQSEKDEPASILLEKIKAEKAQLIKNKIIKAEKPLPLITDEEKLFDIPEDWEWIRLGDLCSYIQRGKSPKYSEIKQIPVVAQKCNQWTGFSLEKAKFIEPKSLESYGHERLLQEGDLLWNSTGLGTLGRIAMYQENLNPHGIAVADSHVTVIRPFMQYLNCLYLLHYFSSPCVQNVIEDKADGSTKQKELATSTIKNYVVPVPPFAEQQRIVEKVERLFAFCDILVDESKIKKYRLPNQIGKFVAFPAFEQEEEHLVAARADKISAETRTKEAERLVLLKRSRK